MLCPQLLEAAYDSPCISDLQLQSVDLAVIQLFCSRAELQSAWLEVRAKRALCCYAVLPDMQVQSVIVFW